MILSCQFKIFSKDYLIKIQSIRNLTIQEIEEEQLRRPYMLYLDIFRSFLKDSKWFKENLNNIHNFIKAHIVHTPPTELGAFYVWMEILQEYAKECNVQTMNEVNNFFDDLSNENRIVFDSSSFQRKDIKRINKTLRERKEIVDRLIIPLQSFFYKYEQDLVHCYP